MGISTLVSSVFHLSALAVLWVLDTVDYICMKSASYIGEGAKTFNITLIFPNGQRHEVTVEHLEPKRIKLLLDIEETSDNKYEVASKNSETDCSKKTSSFLRPYWLVAKATAIVLQVTKIVREQLLSIKALNLESHQTISNGKDTANRKKISPRRRLPKSKISLARRLYSKFMNLIGFPQKSLEFEPIVFDPVEGFDISLNGSLNNSRMKTPKRKERAISESDYSENDDEPQVESKVVEERKLGNENCTNGESKGPESNEDSSVTECSTNESTSADQDHDATEEVIQVNGTAKPNIAPLLKKDYFAEEEDYASADDPDYIPSREGSDESDDDDVDEETSIKLVEEAAQELNLPEAVPYLPEEIPPGSE